MFGIPFTAVLQTLDRSSRDSKAFATLHSPDASHFPLIIARSSVAPDHTINHDFERAHQPTSRKQSATKHTMTYSFLDLPSEIRSTIYEYAQLLDPDPSRSLNISKRSPTEADDERAMPPPALLLAHRQIRQDAFALFYSNHSIYGDPGEVAMWLKASPAKARFIRDICMPCPIPCHKWMFLSRRESPNKDRPSKEWEIFIWCEEGDHSDRATRPGVCVMSPGRMAEVQKITDELQAGEPAEQPPTDNDYLAALVRYLQVFQRKNGTAPVVHSDPCEICESLNRFKPWKFHM